MISRAASSIYFKCPVINNNNNKTTKQGRKKKKVRSICKKKYNQKKLFLRKEMLDFQRNNFKSVVLNMANDL